MSVLDTLEICFSANLSGVDSQLHALKGRLSELSGSGKTYGRALSDGLAAGIRGGTSAVNAAVSAMVNAATKKIRSLLSIHSPSKVTQQYGAYFGEGFAGGVSASAKDAEAAAEKMAAGAVKKLHALPEGNMKLRTEITARASEAERTLEKLRGMTALKVKIGADGAGVTKGLSGGISAVERAAKGLDAARVMKSAPLPERGMDEDALARSVQSAVDRALGGVQLTVPLSVDGIKLGEASIRGINAVTRSAGRLLLNI